MWSYDFVTDRTDEGRQLRLLVVVGQYNRKCRAIEVARSFTAHDVVNRFAISVCLRGTSEHNCSDNGHKFVTKRNCVLLDQTGVKTLFIAKGSQWKNGYVESFNGKQRD